MIAGVDLDRIACGSWRPLGSVDGFVGPIIRARIFGVSKGALCEIQGPAGPIKAVVAACRGGHADLLPLGSEVSPVEGAPVRLISDQLEIYSRHIGAGQAITALGEPIFSPIGLRQRTAVKLDVKKSPPAAHRRSSIRQRLATGVKIIDCICPLGIGQRLGIIAEAGMGKTTLLGMLAGNPNVDVTVVGLVGERGREVLEFVERTLDKKARARSLIVASTSDEPPFMRALAPFTAAAAAEHFAAQGLNVLLLIDSLTRAARAIRDIGLASGEIPVRQGYTASVYTELPRLIERAGAFDKGSITAVYTLLANSKHDVDPLSEELKSLLDGHIILSSDAGVGVRPAVDINESISRLGEHLLSAPEAAAAHSVRCLAREIRESRELAMLSASITERAARILALEPRLKAFTAQRPDQYFEPPAVFETLRGIAWDYQAISGHAD